LATHLSTAWIGALRSVVKVGFQTPLAILPLIRGGGGGSELAASSGPHIVTSPISSTIHLPPYVFHSVPSWPIPFPFPHFHLSPPARCSPPHPPIHPSSSSRPTTLRLPSHLHLYGHLYSLSTCTPHSMPLPPMSYPYLMALLIRCHSITAHPPLPIMCPSLRTGLHALSIRSFSRSRWQQKTSTSQECRVGRAILNPEEAVIEVVGGG
jgi:hypothetical protein